jgi:hypothetical protein
MIVLGKTHTVEFAYGTWGTNFHLGTPRNPWDLIVHRTPGGSSSGSAVAVAAGLVPAAIGTNTAGSIRTPAAWCGIVGLKVTVGRISTYGVLPLSTILDTPGPMNHTTLAHGRVGASVCPHMTWRRVPNLMEAVLPPQLIASDFTIVVAVQPTYYFPKRRNKLLAGDHRIPIVIKPLKPINHLATHGV